MQLFPSDIIPSPYMWTKDDVRAWLKFCSDEFSIQHVRPERFDMNGKALCLLNRNDFMERDPSSGDVLYNALQRLLQGKNDISSLRPPFSGSGSLSPGFPLAPTHGLKGHVPVTQNGIILFTGQGGAYASAAENVSRTGCSVDRVDNVGNTIVGSPYKPILPQPVTGVTSHMAQSSPSLSLSLVSSKPAEVPVLKLMLHNIRNMDVNGRQTATFDTGPHDPRFSMVNHDPLHGLDQTSMHGDNSCHNDDDVSFGGEGDCRLLWEFIYQLLQDRNSREYVCWEGSNMDLVFRIVNPTGLAELWGQQKNRSNMTYEKLSRALRYYYKMNIIKKVPGKRLTYKFLQHPTKIQKGQRGAKPHCLRNLPTAPLRPVPNSSPAGTQQQPQQQQQQQLRASPVLPAHVRSPADSLPPSLSPAVILNEDLPRASSSPLPGSPGRRSAPTSYSFPPTPVHMPPLAAGEGGTGGGVGASVCSTLKDHILRQLQTKPEPCTRDSTLTKLTATASPYDRRKPPHLVASLRRHLVSGEPLAPDDFEYGETGYQKMEYQEEPEDLSMKPALPSSATSSSSSQSSSSPSSSPSASLVCPASYFPSVLTVSRPSSPLNKDERKEEADDDKKLAVMKTNGGIATPQNCSDGRGFPVFPELTLRTDTLSIVKTEPLPLSAS
ncbi:hypothetical protein C0Q70_05195 [Pomacea canaliculata]|uniref:ETS domain-containing protein n=1 Tax=Pomacea canaliculata TaxID=400727 RepID=A0A2T7PKI2_POMCA|nr:hypothetical protein C0Q70_05195 [Pomacea canaliculata]